ncbi:MAG: phosphotransferase [Methylomonas sp.]
MTKNIIIRSPEQINKSWAQHIISHHAAGARVSGVEIRSITIGTTTRLKITVDHDAQGAAPRRWFVKIPSLSLKARLITALPGLLHKEVHFYNLLSHSVPLRLPKVLAAQSAAWLGATVVMGDVSESDFRAGQAADALSLAQAQQVIKQLAQLHAHYWRHPDLKQAHPWLSGFKTRAENHLGTFMATPLMKRGLFLAGELIPAGLHRSALGYAANRGKFMSLLAQGPLTIVHHDCHPGNLFWTDRGPGFLDWQLVRIGEGVGDIAYFLSTALPPESRRANERRLLAYYLSELSELGILPPNEETFYQRYRAHLSYAFEAMVATLAIGGLMAEADNLELIRRTSAAAEENDSFASLSV